MKNRHVSFGESRFARVSGQPTLQPNGQRSARPHITTRAALGRGWGAVHGYRRHATAATREAPRAEATPVRGNVRRTCAERYHQGAEEARGAKQRALGCAATGEATGQARARGRRRYCRASISQERLVLALLVASGEGHATHTHAPRHEARPTGLARQRTAGQRNDTSVRCGRCRRSGGGRQWTWAVPAAVPPSHGHNGCARVESCRRLVRRRCPQWAAWCDTAFHRCGVPPARPASMPVCAGAACAGLCPYSPMLAA